MPPEGYGKFELNVHSNDCYTAGGPSKLTGYPTITDTRADVNNPLFEFDGCFDPNGDDTPTGASFPSAVNVATTSLNPGPDGTTTVELTCATGSGLGRAGTLAAKAGSTDLGSAPFKLSENTHSRP